MNNKSLIEVQGIYLDVRASASKMHDRLLTPCAEKETFTSLMGQNGGQVGPWIQGVEFLLSWLVLVWHSSKSRNDIPEIQEV